MVLDDGAGLCSKSGGPNHHLIASFSAPPFHASLRVPSAPAGEGLGGGAGASRRLVARCIFAALIVATPSHLAHADQPTVTLPANITITGDAIPAPLTTVAADPSRGRVIVLDRANGNCLICHKVPVPTEPFQGTVGPDLSGIGGRLSPGQIRLRLVDQSRLNPVTLMPPFYRTGALTRVDPRYAGKPALTAQAMEDVIAYLATLKD